MITLERERLEELSDYGYHWFGMYPIRYGEVKEKGGILPFPLFEIRTDDSESYVMDAEIQELTEEDFKESMYCIDIAYSLYEAYFMDVYRNSLGTGNTPVCFEEFAENELKDMEATGDYLELIDENLLKKSL